MVRPTHIFAHRGTPNSSSHTRVRWQPYNTSISSQSRTSPYLPTPASSVSSNSSPLHSYGEHSRHAHPLSRECQLREAQKSRYASNLVDQTVKSLCEIWHSQDIPSVFLTSCRPAVPTMQSIQTLSSDPRLYALPSPLSYPSPLPSPPSSYSQLVVYSQAPTIRPSRCELTSMRGFVQEVLRRSRTSGSVLQTALCYVEAIRAKIPELLRRDKEGLRTPAQTQHEDGAIYTMVDGLESSSDNTTLSDGLLATVRIDHTEHEAIDFFSELRLDKDNVSVQRLNISTPLPPLPPLPSPLLCPRRTFLASLILASKFMQDKCYSNRAWAKLSGLPPREIGRCERALGEALEWRLWVGKLPAAQSGSRCSLVKSISENDITTSKPIQPHLQTFSAMAAVASYPGLALQLKRCATYPIVGSCQDEPPVVPSAATIQCAARYETSEGSPAPSTCTTSPPTPDLSFSPTLTESSLGDRTIQVSSFMDVPTPPPSQFAPFVGTQNDKALTLEGPSYSTSRDVSLAPSIENQGHFPNMAPIFAECLTPSFSVSPSLYM
ncbi:hypothetical protein V8B97DRAFT_1931673 [Scleroderma yunnanense]